MSQSRRALLGFLLALPVSAQAKPLVIGAIPDQDPELLQRLYGKLARYLETELGVAVVYKPVTDYVAAVTAFRVGDLDLVWFGGLTGVQARLQVPGAQALAQREIDAQFHSLFMGNKKSGLRPFQDLKGLASLKGRTFTFGSESSTSGRLMPQFFLQQAGVNLEDFKGQPGFANSHDTTLRLVEAGSYEAGAMNEQVFLKRSETGAVDYTRIQVLWRSPAYYDYHWVLNPTVQARYGAKFAERVQTAFLQLDLKVPAQKEILGLFGTQRFIRTQNRNYAQIEQVARQIGKIK
ncbi:putative selenate ABC transporter substrate-binding protein [Candidatus Cyanaurora vandensis]|uniref:putative selenate ABC transporter substrate-binding protein n=1 Tax=Candidatus Cyanaurora vandensis TaxID=2714958 RepID=UPI00257D7EBC|nr:putative selenate ABC transporter substrate-binding protein [Candidatus Cyanaurora vandensis]